MVEWEDPDPGTPPHELRVDIGSIEEFAALLRKEHAEVLGPGVRRLATELGGGVWFGLDSPSADVRRVQDRYVEAMHRNMELGRQYVLATEILVDAAEKIADRFRTAEELTEAQVKDVEGLLADATAAAVRQSDEAAKPVADQARQDELERARLRGFGPAA
jgi:hypothetical protein